MNEHLLNSPPSLRSGDFVHGRFRVAELLGTGAGGIVYRAIDTELDNRPVALKCVHIEWPADKQVIERLSREVLLTRRLRHPNIVSVYEIIPAEERAPVVVMEVVDGGTLAAFIKADECGRVPFCDRIELLRQIANALAYAHGEGIVHRDIKPENILLTLDGDAKVADFGLARCFEEDQRLTKTGASLGTPYYMSPEQFRGEEAGPAADIYSFGILGYELLSGRKPYVDDVYFSLALKHVLDPLPPLEASNGELPPWVFPLLLKCTAKKVEDRFASMGEVAAILDAKRAHGSGSARSEAIVRLKRGERRARTRGRFIAGGRIVLTTISLIILLQLSIVAVARINWDMRQRMEAVALKAETIFGSSALRPLKRMLGIGSIRVASSGDLFRELDGGDGTNSHLRAFIWAGANLSVRDADGNTPLIRAASGMPTIFALMLDRGADINATGKDGITPFDALIKGGLASNWTSERDLSKVDLRIRDDRGWNAFHYAVSIGAVEVIRAIAADPRAKQILRDREGYGNPPLAFAVQRGIPSQEDVVRALIDGGADPGQPVPGGGNALFLAIGGRLPAAALIIAERGGRELLEQRDSRGFTPLERLLSLPNLSADELRLAELLRSRMDVADHAG